MPVEYDSLCSFVFPWIAVALGNKTVLRHLLYTTALKAGLFLAAFCLAVRNIILVFLVNLSMSYFLVYFSSKPVYFFAIGVIVLSPSMESSLVLAISLGLDLFLSIVSHVQWNHLFPNTPVFSEFLMSSMLQAHAKVLSPETFPLLLISGKKKSLSGITVVITYIIRCSSVLDIIFCFSLILFSPKR